MRRTLLLLLLVVLAAGCAAASSRLHGQASWPLAAQRRLPLLPAGLAPRSAAVAHTTVIGADAAAQSAGAYVNGTRMVLPALSGGLEWAYYELPTNGNPVLGVEASLALPDGAAYVGLSNYVRGSWEFQQATAADVALPAGAANVSPGGFVYLAVAAYDTSEMRVLSVSVVLDQPGWVIHAVAGGGSVALAYPKLFADGPDGRPHIAYVNLSSRQIRLARSTVELPEQPADWEDVLVDVGGAGIFGVALDAQFISAKPAVAYCNSTNDELLYAHASSALPADISDWTSSVVADAFTALYPQISLCELALMPRLAYSTAADGMMLAASNSATPGDADWDRTLIDADARRPALLDLGLELGLCYLKFLPGGVIVGYAYSTTGSPSGPADWESSELYPTPYEEFPGATAIAKVRPAGEWLPFLAVLPAASRELHVFLSSAPHPLAADWSETTLDAAPGITTVAACTVLGRPAVAYAENVGNSVLVAWSVLQQPGQLADWQFSTVGGNGGGRYVSVAEVAGAVAVAYVDNDSSELRFAYLSP